LGGFLPEWVIYLKKRSCPQKTRTTPSKRGVVRKKRGQLPQKEELSAKNADNSLKKRRCPQKTRTTPSKRGDVGKKCRHLSRVFRHHLLALFEMTFFKGHFAEIFFFPTYFLKGLQRCLKDQVHIFHLNFADLKGKFFFS
jgi:hypothetical protein